MKDIHDIITHAKFGDNRLRGSGVVAGQISAFPIDFAGRPYNTLALPCERVMYRVGQKNRTVFRLDNFVTVSPRKACSTSKFSQFSHFSEFKYSLPNLLKSPQQLKLCYI